MWAILMLMRLSPKAHILFVHMTTNVEICLITDESEIQEISMIFYSLTNGFPQKVSLSLTCIYLKF